MSNLIKNVKNHISLDTMSMNKFVSMRKIKVYRSLDTVSMNKLVSMSKSSDRKFPRELFFKEQASDSCYKQFPPKNSS